MIVPGWYPDPLDPHRVRYWNGAQWSEQTQARYAEPSAPDVAPHGSTAAAPAARPRARAGEPTAPNPWFRLLIGLVDVVVTLPLVVLATAPVWMSTWGQAWDAAQHGETTSLPPVTSTELAINGLATLGVWFVYGLLMTRLAGGTVGQLVCGTRVRDLHAEVDPSGARPRVSWSTSARRALVRALLAALAGQYLLGSGVALLGGALLMINLWLATSTPQHRSLTDLAAGTDLVNRAPR